MNLCRVDPAEKLSFNFSRRENVEGLGDREEASSGFRTLKFSRW